MRKPTNDNDKYSLENIRKVPVKTLIELDMRKLKKLQKQADKAVFKAKLAKDWIDGAIAFKLHKNGKR